MGKSFFLGTDAELYSGSAAFSTQISATPTAFGLTAPQATAYATLNDAYATAYLAATDPSTRSKPKTAAKNDAKFALKVMASNLAKIIEGTPTVTTEQKESLGISVRATPSPRPAPGTPTNFKALIGGDGSLTLGWRCNNPRGCPGTIYQVWRRVGASGDFAYVGGTGERKFLDATIPAGSSQVTYQIQAVRSTTVGPWAQFNVNFGIGGGGAMTASVREEKVTKLAA